MKKFLLTILALCTILLFTGCKKNISILTDEFTVYIGQNFELSECLTYEETDLENVSFKIIAGEVDLLKVGSYPVTVEASADNAKITTKQIIINVKDFEDSEELYAYAQKVLSQYEYNDLECSLSKYDSLYIIGNSFTKTMNSKTTIQFTPYISGVMPVEFATLAELDDENPNKVTPLSNQHYSFAFDMDISQKTTSYDNNNYYRASSLILKSDSGSYELWTDKKPLPDWDAESLGTYSNPNYLFKTSIFCSFDNWDELTKIINGDNLKLTLIAHIGIDEANPLETIEVTFTEDEISYFKELLSFSQHFFYENTSK